MARRFRPAQSRPPAQKRKRPGAFHPTLREHGEEPVPTTHLVNTLAKWGDFSRRADRDAKKLELFRRIGFEAGEHGCPFLPGTPIIIMPKAKVALYWYACVDGRLESFVSSYWKEDHVDEIVQKYSYTDFTGAESARIQEDKECCERLSVLMFKLLVVLNTRPNLVEPGTRLRPASTRKGKTRSELWSPNIIGAKYRVLREHAVATGTHASPRLHWRRGHLRNQAHGPGRTLRKLAWIEPTLVGMQETTPAQSKGLL